MKLIVTAVALGLACGASFALAATEQNIFQKDRKFSKTEVSLKKGDTLVFINDDTIAHNVMSTTPGNEFNLKSLSPGTSTPVAFDKLGEIKVICAIHPAMRMTVKVE